LTQTGTFKFFSVDWGREKGVQTPVVEEHVLDHVFRAANVSTKQVGEELNVSYMTIFRILHEQLHHPYHLNECRVSCLLIDVLERTFVSVLFSEVLNISVPSVLLQVRHILIETEHQYSQQTPVGRGKSSPDFYLWGHLKSLVYAAPVNEEALHHCIVDACQTSHNYPTIFEQIWWPVMRHVSMH
jgi:hypothetical protein